MATNGTINGLLVQRYGLKLTGALGALVNGLAVSACFFANSLTFLIVAQCVLVGVGTSFISIACLTMVKQSFEGKAKYVALSLVGIGPGVGGMLHTYVTEYLFNKYGLRGTFLVSGALQLNAFSIMMGWPGDSCKQQNSENDPEILSRMFENLKTMCAAVRDNCVYSFVLVSIGFALTQTAQNIFMIFITDLIVEKKMANYLASLTIFLFAMLVMLGRLVPGFVKLIPRCSAMLMPVIAAVLATIANASIVFTDTEYGVILCCSLSGIAYGMAIGSSNIVPVKLLDKGQYAAGVGFIMTLSGTALLITGPINGFIKDTTGSYTAVYLMAAAFSGAGCVLLLVTVLVRRNLYHPVALGGKQRYWILMSTMICNTVSRGHYYSNGRLFVPIMDTFKTTRAETGLFMSTSLAVHMCTGTINGLLVQRYGPKLTGAVGALATGLGVSVGFFANSLAFLIVVQCSLVAIGSSLINIACLTMVKQTFEGKAQYVALLCVGIGPAVGGMLNTYVTEILFYKYGLRGTFLILGALQLNAFSMMMGWPGNSSEKERSDKDQEVFLRIVDALKRMCAVVTDTRVYSFVLVTIGLVLILTMQKNVIMFITDLIVEKNMANYLASLTIFMYSLWSILGHLLPGCIKLIPHCPVTIIPVIAAVLGAIANVLIVFTETEYVVVVCCSLSGIAFGMAAGSAVILPVKLLNSDQYASSIGFIMTLWGIALLIAGPTNGFIKDTTGSYTTVYIMAAAFSSLGGILILATQLIRRKLNRRVAVIT